MPASDAPFAVRLPEGAEYRVYLANIEPESLDAGGVAQTYAARSQLELIFRELKSHNKPASCITFLSEQAFAPQNTRFWSRSRVWFQFTVGEDKPPLLSVDNRGKGVLSMDCSAKRSPF